MYRFLPGLGPGEVTIAEMPGETYKRLLQDASAADDVMRAEVAVDPAAKIRAGKRRETVFRYASMQRRWTGDEAAIRGEILLGVALETDEVRRSQHDSRGCASRRAARSVLQRTQARTAAQFCPMRREHVSRHRLRSRSGCGREQTLVRYM